MAGPTTVNTNTLALGLAQIRIGGTSTMTANSGEIAPVLSSSDSIGSVENSKFVGNTEWYKHSSGFPLLEDYTIPLRDSAAIECAFEEITPYNLSLALGNDPTAMTDAVSGEITLGSRTAPSYVRSEVVYTFPAAAHEMVVIFPLAQVTSSVEIDLQKEEAANVPITIESKICNHASWSSMKLGRIIFQAAS